MTVSIGFKKKHISFSFISRLSEIIAQLRS